MKFYLFVLISFFLPGLQDVVAQEFSFLPSAEYSAALEMEVYSEHQINVYHDLTDSAYISWRVIEDTYPEGWDVQLCDWQHCYTYLPNTGDMIGVAAGGSGYVRLLVNPMDIPGNAHFLFWIFPTGDMEDHVDIVFDLNTVIAGVDENGSKPHVFTSEGILHFSHLATGPVRIYSSTGRLVEILSADTPHASHDIGHYTHGIYIVVASDGASHAFIIP